MRYKAEKQTYTMRALVWRTIVAQGNGEPNYKDNPSSFSTQFTHNTKQAYSRVHLELLTPWIRTIQAPTIILYHAKLAAKV